MTEKATGSKDSLLCWKGHGAWTSPCCAGAACEFWMPSFHPTSLPVPSCLANRSLHPIELLPSAARCLCARTLRGPWSLQTSLKDSSRLLWQRQAQWGQVSYSCSMVEWPRSPGLGLVYLLIVCFPPEHQFLWSRDLVSSVHPWTPTSRMGWPHARSWARFVEWIPKWMNHSTAHILLVYAAASTHVHAHANVCTHTGHLSYCMCYLGSSFKTKNSPA